VFEALGAERCLWPRDYSCSGGSKGTSRCVCMLWTC